jgi:ribosomal protein S18 acetylase RimI-like enzyme
VRIREAIPADAEPLAGIHVRAWQAAYRGQLSDEYLDGLRAGDRIDMHRRTLAEPREGWRTWVAVEGEQVVGFAVTGPSEDADAEQDTGEVFAIYLEPERVGTGVGRRLFAYALLDLRKRGFRSATLWVLETNEQARRFYERAGWRFDGTTAGGRVDCEMRPTVRYRTDLT